MTGASRDGLQEPMSVAEAVAKVLVSDFSLQVSKEDAAFICGIHAHLDITRQPSLEEDELELIFHTVAEASIGDGVSYRQRAGMAIQRLRKQGLLERADARGMASFGSYTLSTLAIKLRDDIFEREALTRRSLQVMMKRVIGDLATIRHAAEHGGDKAYWEERVIDQLRFLVAEVIRAIGHRQKGLEADQLEIRRKIHVLLKSDNWRESIQLCDDLLESTGNTLEELHKILLEEMGAAQNLLTEIGDVAERRDQTEAFDMVQRLQEQIGSISAWSHNFQSTWSEYYTKAHEFIRFNLRIDPNRKLAQRLRESVKQYARQPWAIQAPAGQKFRYLREDAYAPARKTLARVNVKPRREAEDVAEEKENLKRRMIDAIKQVLQQEGRVVLSEFLQPYIHTFNDDDLFLVVGTLHGWLMSNVDVMPKRESAWIDLRDGIEIQDVTGVIAKLSVGVIAQEERK